jgi:murein DD-endopeptidase MepM/ murein hydrolase activator NlpD
LRRSRSIRHLGQCTGTFDEIPVRSSYFDFATERDQEVLARYRAVAESYEAQQLMIEESFATQEALVVEISALAEDILSRLEAADQKYRETVATWERQEEERRRREEEARRRAEEAARLAAEEAARNATTTTAAPSSGSTETTTTTTAAETGETTTTTTAPPPPPPPPPITTDGKTCPVNGATSFSDSWGAPRSGGRSHKGVDMIAARGTPLVAIESGVIERTSNSSLGGISLYLRGGSGDRYYYAHLDGIASGISGGVSVSVGDVVGYNGSTGNAPSWLPHLHFQWAPAGSDWVNPYPLVADLCR